MKKNSFLTFVCACIPGFGQMYYGYMRRGLSLTAWFWGIVFVAGFTGLGLLSVLLPVVWAFAFFDTYNIRNLSPEQRAVFEDDFIPNSEFLRSRNLGGFFKKGRAGLWVGWGLVIAGILILYNIFLSNIYWTLYNTFPFLSHVLDSLPALVIAGVVIGIGIHMLRGRKDAPPQGPGAPNDDITPYAGGNQP